MIGPEVTGWSFQYQFPGSPHPWRMASFPTRAEAEQRQRWFMRAGYMCKEIVSLAALAPRARPVAPEGPWVRAEGVVTRFEQIYGPFALERRADLVGSIQAALASYAQAAVNQVFRAQDAAEGGL